jgi:membrane protein DedA with SNARE-associated domain
VLDALLTHGSLALFFVALFATGFGFPVPEDVVLLAAGALAHRGIVPLAPAVAVCMAGVLAGDVVLFVTARRLGPGALDRPLFRRILPPERRRKLEGFLEARGGAAVFIARHVAGFRAPVFALAGMHGMPLARFILWDALALCISAPAVFTLGWWSSAHLELARRGLARLEHWLLLGVALVVLGYSLFATLRRRAPRGSGRSSGPG